MTNYIPPEPDPVIPEIDPVELWYQTDKTQAQLAELLGVDTTTFARWCNRSRNPSAANKRLAAQLAQKLLNCQ